jgi:hypothetical protein
LNQESCLNSMHSLWKIIFNQDLDFMKLIPKLFNSNMDLGVDFAEKRMKFQCQIYQYAFCPALLKPIIFTIVCKRYIFAGARLVVQNILDLSLRLRQPVKMRITSSQNSCFSGVDVARLKEECSKYTRMGL